MKFLILLLSLFCFQSVLAQSKQPASKQPVTPTNAHEDTVAQSASYKQMVQDIGLSIQQAKEVFRILKLSRFEIIKLKADSTLTPLQKAEQLRGISGWKQRQLATIISPEQYQKMGALLLQRNQQRERAGKVADNVKKDGVREFRPVNGGALKSTTLLNPQPKS